MSQSNMSNYETTATLETFGFLPKFDNAEIQAQIAYVLANGWSPAIEHTPPEAASEHYWTMWKLPFFGETDLGHVRLTGYDNYTQSQGACFVVFEAR